MTEKRFQLLIEKYLSEDMQPSERLELQDLLSDPERARQLESIIDKELLLRLFEIEPDESSAADIDRHFEKIWAGPSSSKPVHRIHFLKTAWLRYAAAIIILFAGGAYLWTANQKDDQALAGEDKQSLRDLPPGKEGAILTLADGTEVILDSIENGVVASQNGTKLVLENGLLAYNPTGSSSGAITYNTMKTPKGRQFRLILPDGSKVWLNAASSIKYPTVFTGPERVVEIDGEAYFEIEKYKSRPFRVKVNDATTIEVLGTRFNVNSYEDEEAIKTTLMEGSVRINAYKNLRMLKPGQQAIVTPAQKIEVMNGVDMDKALAWKSGLFNFEDASLEEVMRQLSRWYDLQVVYEKEIPNIEFAGKMRRDVSLAGVLKGLKGANVNFRLEEGRRLVVMP